MITAIKWLALLVAVVIVLAVAGLFFENWRGERDWKNCKAELEAKGEHLTIDYFIPPAVPDEKNFALTPLMKPLLDLVKDPATGNYVARDPDPPVKKISAKVIGANMAFPKSKGWVTGNARPLEEWQAYYRESLPDMGLSKSPAEDIIAALGRFDAMFAELRQDLQTHPLCRYPVHYELGVATPLPHLSVIQAMITALSLRASAELQMNRPAEALADLQLAFQLAGTIRDEPTLIGGLVRLTAVATLFQPIWEGIAAHRWDMEQLSALEKDLRGWDFFSDFNRCMRTERATANSVCEQLRADPSLFATISGSQNGQIAQIWKALGPVLQASVYRNQILINTMVQDKFLNIMDEKAQTVNMAHAKDSTATMNYLRVTPYTVLARITMPVYLSVEIKFALIQTYANEAAIACEIERYRLAHGALPATLEQLHLADLPHDVINGQPLHYRVTGDDNYMLYSVGWNETDDGGKVVFKPKPDDHVLDTTQGDWVWTLKPL